MVKYVQDNCNKRFSAENLAKDQLGPQIEDYYDFSVTRNQLFYQLD